MGVYWRNNDNDLWLLGHAIHVKRVGGEMRSIWRIWALALLALAVSVMAAERCQYYENGQNVCYSGGDCTCSNGYQQGRTFWSGCRWVQGNYGSTCNCHYACESKCAADSVMQYAACVADSRLYWDSDECACKERTDADSVFTVCTEDVRNGAPYYQIYVVNVHYKNGVLESACGVSPNLINGEGYKQYCALKRSGNGTCANAGVPNGPSEPKPCNGDCSQAGQEMVPNAECYAVVGYNCYLKDIRTGNTFKCECDGSCSKAMTDLIRPFGDGANCRNPYNNPSSSPSSSDSGGSSSPSSSDSGGDSSPSSSPSSGTSGIDYTEQLNQLIANTQGIMNNTGDISEWTQTTMNNTTDIKNEVSNIGIDVGNIRDNTAATKDNTYNIANQMSDLFNQFVNYVGNQNQNQHAINSSLDSIRNSNKSVNGHVQSMDGKLTQTNSLLDSLTKKEWGVSVEVAGDTIINNVNVQGDTNIINVTTDTSKAPAEILGLLQNALQGEGNSSDTNGMGAQIDGWMGKIDDLIGDTSKIRMNGDSVNHAMDNLYSGGYGAIRDTLGNSSIADSMDAWTNELVDNGKISGDGSDQCPSVLSRTWRVDFPIGNSTVGVDIGPLGRYLCNDVAGLGITFWALCRVILRALVAIGCMIWLYKTALGMDGGSNEED